MNLQYDIYRNTKEVLKAIKMDNKDLLHNFPSQGAIISFLLEHSFPKLNTIWSATQSNLPINIFNFTIKYLSNTLPTRKNLFRWSLSQTSDCQFWFLLEILLHVVAGCKVCQSEYVIIIIIIIMIIIMIIIIIIIII